MSCKEILFYHVYHAMGHPAILENSLTLACRESPAVTPSSRDSPKGQVQVSGQN